MKKEGKGIERKEGRKKGEREKGGQAIERKKGGKRQ